MSWVTELIRAGAGLEPLSPLPVRRGWSLSPKSCIFISFHKKEALAPESAKLWQNLCWSCFGQRRAASLWKGDCNPVLSPEESVKGGRSLWSDQCGRKGRDCAGNAVVSPSPHPGSHEARQARPPLSPSWPVLPPVIQNWEVRLPLPLQLKMPDTTDATACPSCHRLQHQHCSFQALWGDSVLVWVRKACFHTVLCCLWGWGNLLNLHEAQCFHLHFCFLFGRALWLAGS